MYLYELCLDEAYNPKLEKVKQLKGKEQLLSTAEAVEFCNQNFNMENLMQEHVYLIGCNTHQIITGVFLMNKGMMDKSSVGLKEVLTALLLTGSSRFMLVHNHPNNDLTVSNADMRITSQLMYLSALLEVEFLEHAIVTRNGYTSMKEEGKM